MWPFRRKEAAQPTLEDTGYTIGAIANLASLGYVFDEVVLLDQIEKEGLEQIPPEIRQILGNRAVAKFRVVENPEP